MGTKIIMKLSLHYQHSVNNFVWKDNVYKHHSNEEALNSLSKEVSRVDFCLKQKIDKPFLLIVAEQSMDDFSKEKVKVYQKLHTNLSVTVISKGHHFLPITNPIQVANTLKEKLPV